MGANQSRSASDQGGRVLWVSRSSPSAPQRAAVERVGLEAHHVSDTSNAVKALRNEVFQAVVWRGEGDTERVVADALPWLDLAGALPMVVTVPTATPALAKQLLNVGASALVEDAEGADALARQLQRAVNQRVEPDQRESRNDAALAMEDEARFRRLVEYAPVMMNVIDEQLQFLVWNRECERVTGYLASEVIGNPQIFERLYPDADYRAAMFDEWARRGDFRDWELTLTCKDGSRRTVAWSNLSKALPVPGWFTWGVGVDVTEQKRAQQALRERAGDLARVTRLAALGEFSAELAHEVKQPLHAIGNYCDALAQYLGDAPPAAADAARRCLEAIVDQTSRAAAVIDQVRRRATQTARPAGTADVADAIREAVAWVEGDLQRSGARLVVDLPEDARTDAFSSATSASLLRARAERVPIEQVLLNLIRNALEAMEQTPPARRLVRVWARPRGALVEIGVDDAGPGLSSEEVERLSEPLVTTKPGGMGMGLTICRRIVHDQGGELTCVESPEGGASFRFTLPRVGEEAAR